MNLIWHGRNLTFELVSHFCQIVRQDQLNVWQKCMSWFSSDVEFLLNLIHWIEFDAVEMWLVNGPEVQLVSVQYMFLPLFFYFTKLLSVSLSVPGGGEYLQYTWQGFWQTFIMQTQKITWAWNFRPPKIPGIKISYPPKIPQYRFIKINVYVLF